LYSLGAQSGLGGHSFPLPSSEPQSDFLWEFPVSPPSVHPLYTASLPLFPPCVGRRDGRGCPFTSYRLFFFFILSGLLTACASRPLKILYVMKAPPPCRQGLSLKYERTDWSLGPVLVFFTLTPNPGIRTHPPPKRFGPVGTKLASSPPVLVQAGPYSPQFFFILEAPPWILRLFFFYRPGHFTAPGFPHSFPSVLPPVPQLTGHGRLSTSRCVRVPDRISPPIIH